MEATVGRVLAKVRALGQEDNTLIFFISDNGGPLAQTAVNTPLRGGKHQDYEGGIRVPGIVRWPGHIKAGTVSDVPVIGTDIFATVLEVAGAMTSVW